MPNYKITILRTEYADAVFEVTAENLEEAKELAMSEAYNTDWSRGNADYEIESIQSDEDHSTEN